MPPDLQRDEPRRAHRPDQVRSIFVDRRQARDAALGQVFEDDGRRLQAVLVAGELVVRDLDQRRVAQRDPVLAVVPVDPGLQRESGRHGVTGLVTPARCDRNCQRAGGQSHGRERGAPVVGCPLEVGDLPADRGLDRHRFHRVVERELQRRRRVDLHPVLELRAVARGQPDDARDNDRGEAPLPAPHAVMADVVDREQPHGVSRQLGQRLRRRPCVLRLARHRVQLSVGRRRDREGGLEDVRRHRPGEREREAAISGDVLLTALDVRGHGRRQGVLVGEKRADADQHDEHHHACGSPAAAAETPAATRRPL